MPQCQDGSGLSTIAASNPDSSHRVVESPPVETPHLVATKGDSNKKNSNQGDPDKAGPDQPGKIDPSNDETKVDPSKDPNKVTTKPLDDTKLKPLARTPGRRSERGQQGLRRGARPARLVWATATCSRRSASTSPARSRRSRIVKSPPEISTDLQRALMGWRYAPYKNKDSKVSPVCFPLTLRVVLEELAGIGVTESTTNVGIGERAQRDLGRADAALTISVRRCRGRSARARSGATAGPAPGSGPRRATRMTAVVCPHSARSNGCSRERSIASGAWTSMTRTGVVVDERQPGGEPVHRSSMPATRRVAKGGGSSPARSPARAHRPVKARDHRVIRPQIVIAEDRVDPEWRTERRRRASIASMYPANRNT